MRSRFQNLQAGLVAAAALIGLLSASQSANALTWTLTDVPLTDGGTLSGTFTLNSYGYFGSFDISTTSGGEGFSESYFSPPPVAGNINTTNPPVAGNVIDLFPNDDPALGVLQLTFAHSLSTPGINPIIIGNAASFECLGSYSCYLTGQTVTYAWGTFGPKYSADTRYIGSNDIDTADVAFAATTPLPPTWTMLIAGFVGLVGFVAFGGKKRNVAATAAA
jgi:hypothetical protein